MIQQRQVHPGHICILLASLGVSALSVGCDCRQKVDGILVTPMAIVQERITNTEFFRLIATDPQLEAVVEFAKTNHQARTLREAGKIADDNGVEIVWAEYRNTDIAAPNVVIVRHCRNGDCVSAVQNYVGGDEEITWLTPGGLIPVRTVAEPYLFKIYDESTGLSYIPPVNEHLRQLAARLVIPDIGSADPPALPVKPVARRASTKFRAYSAFGKYFVDPRNDVPRAVAGLPEVLIAAGCPDSTATYNATDATIDAALSSLGADDIFVLYGHGALSASRGRVIGMTVSDHTTYWRHEFVYTEDRFVQQMSANANGGPGLIFLSGCASAGMLPALNTKDRIVLGFSHEHFNQNIYNAMLLFFERYTGGDTLGAAIAAVNALPGMSNSGVSLMVNADADLNRKFDGTTTTPPEPECNPSNNFEILNYRNFNGSRFQDGAASDLCLSGDPDNPTFTWPTSAAADVSGLTLTNMNESVIVWGLLATGSAALSPPVTMGVVPPGMIETDRDLQSLSHNGDRYELQLETKDGNFLTFEFKSRPPAGGFQDRVYVWGYGNHDGNSGGPGSDPSGAAIQLTSNNGDLSRPIISWTTNSIYETIVLEVDELDTLSSIYRTEYGVTVASCQPGNSFSSPIQYGDYGRPGVVKTNDASSQPRSLKRGCQYIYRIQVYTRAIGDGGTSCLSIGGPVLQFSIIDGRNGVAGCAP